MSYKGKYHPKNKEKYQGNPSDIVYRSLWERQVFKWCDANPDVKSWGSETVIVPYICKTDGKYHRYFVDVKIQFVHGKTILVEIKPEKQTTAPVKSSSSRMNKKYLKEVHTYAKNVSKWQAAKEFAEERNWEFHIWTENTLKHMGIEIVPGPRAMKNKLLREQRKKRT